MIHRWGSGRGCDGLRALLAVIGLVTAGFSNALADKIPPPEKVFGHPVGADRKLVRYPEVLRYLERVAKASDRVSIEEAGASTMNQRMPIVVLTWIVCVRSPGSSPNPAN